MLDEATGELTERRLDHQSGEAEAFYRNLQAPVRVGIEATEPIRWFERLLPELGHELWIGDSGGWASRPVPRSRRPKDFRRVRSTWLRPPISRTQHRFQRRMSASC